MRIAFLLFTAFLLSACQQGTERGKIKTIDPAAVYYDLKIVGEEAKPEVTIVLHRRFGDEEGNSTALPEGASIAVDGEKMQADSAKQAGVFYELLKAASGFAGLHKLKITDQSNTLLEEDFTFQPFTLATEPAERVKMQPFTLKLLNGNDLKKVQLVLVDTSFSSRDVNEEVRVRDGEIKITQRHLNNLAAGPVTLEIYRDDEKWLQNGPKTIVRLQQTYSLRRQFELAE